MSYNVMLWQLCVRFNKMILVFGSNLRW